MQSVDIGTVKQRTLLAALLCQANSVVPVRRLLEVLWPDGPPPAATKNIQGYVSGLRKIIAGANLDQAADKIAQSSGSGRTSQPGQQPPA